MDWSQLPRYLLPWEFSYLWLLACVIPAALYVRGFVLLSRAGAPVPVWRGAVFLLGILLMYAVTMTHYDYLSQFMFFTHRAQHLILHHLGPFLIALSWPLPVLAAGTPRQIQNDPALALARPLVAPIYRTLQNPVVAPLLFVGLIFFWLQPTVHYYAMLSEPLYHVMNWSMAIDGLLYWFLVFDPRTPDQGGLAYRWRIAGLIAVAPPQIILGAYITLSSSELFEVYAVCGRAWDLNPLVDQQIGGLITWIPAAMMSLMGVMVVMRMMFDHERTKQTNLEQEPHYATS